MSFGSPYWLCALALVPALFVLFVWNERRRRELLQKIVASRLHETLVGSVSTGKRRVQFLLLLASLACVIVSLAEPRYGYTWEQSKRKGRDVIIAIDTSKSMLSTDIAPDRLTRAKLAAQDLIGMLPGDRVGVIAFAGSAFLQAPLTIDYSAALSSINELDTNIIPRGGTDIAEAIRVAADAFGKGESENRALILFTDGEELDESGVEAARKQAENFRTFTVGVGSAEGSIIPVPGEDSGTSFVKDEKGQIVKSRLDENRLREIAEAAGGFYIPLENGPATMKRIVTEGFGQMKERDIDARQSRRPIERYQWPLALGLLLLGGSLLVNERKRVNKIISAKPQSALIAILAFVFSSSAYATWDFGIGKVRSELKNAGVEKYEQGIREKDIYDKDPNQTLEGYNRIRELFQGAYDDFKKQFEKEPDSPLANFNLGTAAFQLKKFDDASVSFGKALLSNDPKQIVDAEMNIGHTLYHRGNESLKKNERAETLKDWKCAVDHYDSALKTDPKNEKIGRCRDFVKSEIDRLEKEPPKQDQNKDQKKDQDQKQDQKNQQSKSDQNQKDKDQKDSQQQQNQQQQGSKDQKDQDSQAGKDENKKDESAQNQQGSDSKQQQNDKQKDGGQKDQNQQQQMGNEPQNNQAKAGATPEPTPSDKKLSGDIKAQSTPGEKPDDQQQGEAAVPIEPGKMTEAQARALIESLKGEDQRVLLEQKRATPVLKDW